MIQGSAERRGFFLLVVGRGKLLEPVLRAGECGVYPILIRASGLR
jgi:hypothetical protein